MHVVFPSKAALTAGEHVTGRLRLLDTANAALDLPPTRRSLYMHVWIDLTSCNPRS